MDRILNGLILLGALIWAVAAHVPVAGAQSITLTSPASAMNYAEGDDYATTVVGNPWDMNELRDIPYDINYQQPTVSAGVWSAVSHPYTGGGVGYFYLLFRGYADTYPWRYDYYSYYDAGMPYGPLNPIDASRYSRLSIRQSMDYSQNRSFIFINWLKTMNENEANLVFFVDADRAPNAYVTYPGGFRIYDIDLTGQAYLNDRLPSIIDPLHQGGTWADTVYGIHVMPSSQGPAGMIHKIDWIRLYNPATSSILPIRWATTGVSPADESYSVRLFLDRDAQGYDGDLCMSGIRNAGRYDVYTAALPPGDYYFYLKLMRTEARSFTTVATSGYSPKISIRATPTFQFTSPSFTTGTDYATAELGNPWDMNSSADVIASGHISGLTVGGGMLRGSADPPVPPATESDCYIFLNTKRNGVFVPIDTTRYRYLTFRMMVDPAGYTNILDRIQRGWLARFQWAKTYFEVDGSYSMSVYLLEGWHSYTVDLWDDGLLDPTPGLNVPQTGWRTIKQANLFRMDPLEVYNPTVFYIDDVKLCTYNGPENNAFIIRWQAAGAAAGDPLTVTLYYGYYDGTGAYQETAQPIAVVQNAQKINSCAWNTTGLNPGEYYIRAIVSDGLQQLSRLSVVPVIIRSGLIPVAADFDADQKTDYAVYDQSSGEWTIILSGDRSVNTLMFGGVGYTPLAADFDGDGKADPAIYNTTTGQWQVMLSANGYARATAGLGGAGYTPVGADFDGDGKADLGVYCAATGLWKDIRSASGYAVAASFLGGPGYVPLVGDFNGNGRVDPAVYNPTSGRWQVLWQVMLSSGATKALATSGASDWQPVSGDYDGDGKVDLAVYRQSSGQWWVLLSGSEYAAVSTTLGGVGLQPVAGDFDGDGKTDPAVFSESVGRWTIMLSGSDYALCSVP